jgi:hypothetical protein
VTSTIAPISQVNKPFPAQSVRASFSHELRIAPTTVRSAVEAIMKTNFMPLSPAISEYALKQREGAEDGSLSSLPRDSLESEIGASSPSNT